MVVAGADVGAGVAGVGGDGVAGLRAGAGGVAAATGAGAWVVPEEDGGEAPAPVFAFVNMTTTKPFSETLFSSIVVSSFNTLP